MPELRSCLWLAMPPTALLSLASLITYLAFRLAYLATARNVTESSQDGDASNVKLRTLALPWIFFGLEMIILCMSTPGSSSTSYNWLNANTPSTQCDPIHSPDPSDQACRPRKTTCSWRRCT